MNAIREHSRLFSASTVESATVGQVDGVALIVGSREYSLSRREAEFLAEWLRDHFTDELLATDGLSAREGEIAQQGQRLALALTVELEEERGEKIDLGWREVAALSDVLRDYLVKSGPGLEELYNAVRRFEGNPEYHF